MSTVLICLFPIAYTALAVAIGFYLGRHGSPIRWVGFRRPRGSVRVEKEFG
jgi:hypothetical protein